MTLIFEPHNLFRSPPFEDEGAWPFGYISEGVGQPIFALYEDVGQRPIGELRRYAALFTSAPALLEAAKQAFDFLGGVDGASEIRAKLLAAIAKASPSSEGGE
ncbi:MAG: hypothetical protein V4657_13485 [Pseudomonadota bacterium]